MNWRTSQWPPISILTGSVMRVARAPSRRDPFICSNRIRLANCLTLIPTSVTTSLLMRQRVQPESIRALYSPYDLFVGLLG